MATYNKENISFMYPENWTLSEQASDPIDHSPREISLESPSGSIWVLHVFDHAADPEVVLAEVVAGLDQQYEDFEYAASDAGEVAGIPSIGGEANFYCLDFLVTATVRVLKTDEHLFCILSQAESRDFDAMEKVFLAMTTSLVTSDPAVKSQ